MNLGKDLWKKCSPVSYFKDIQIPESWDTVEDFTNWYLEQRMPLMIPWDAQVVKTDDATAICIFRKPPYQIELYLIHPNKTVERHAHPGMDVITMTLGGGKIDTKSIIGTSSCWGDISENLKNGEFHGGERSISQSMGFVLLSFEKWPAEVPMTSAAIHWQGTTAGPLHDHLIENNYPGSVVSPGYANVNQNK